MELSEILESVFIIIGFAFLSLMFVSPMIYYCWQTEKRIKVKKKWLEENKDKENIDWENSPFCSYKG